MGLIARVLTNAGLVFLRMNWKVIYKNILYKINLRGCRGAGGEGGKSGPRRSAPSTGAPAVVRACGLPPLAATLRFSIVSGPKPDQMGKGSHKKPLSPNTHFDNGIALFLLAENCHIILNMCIPTQSKTPHSYTNDPDRS